ncbi:flagellar basal body rod protein FlgG [Anaerobacillus sp. MEB173]|uniref:flagellar basal body rod protein FlgG n=1 Tax=Anaerobacillus sp. MEB173 TaxID=3383345 RepID=UPI003F92D204
MLRSMYSGIAGMKNFQVKLDVIGNNIANVNTYGFKKGRTTFSDLVNQQIAGASAPGPQKGGTNPMQVGLGAQLASIDTIHTQGSLQNTSRALDLGISGDGYFVVWNGQEGDAAEYSYTRAGNFYFDQNGDVVNSDGLFVVGINQAGDDLQKINVPTTAQSFSIGSDGVIRFIENGTLDEAGQIALAKFSNPEGLQKIGGNLFQQTANSGLAAFQFEETPDGNLLAYITRPESNGTGALISGTLEMSNVDLSEEFTEMIVAQRGFQANTRIITTSDEILQELVNLKR